MTTFDFADQSCCTTGLRVSGGTLFLALNDELWRSDGTTEGTSLVKDIAPRDGASILEGPVMVGDVLYFAVGRGKRGELWRSDGTPEGTIRLLALASE